MFKAIGDALNKVATNLFINAKAKARLKNYHYDCNREQVSKAKAIYEIQIKRYFFGIGFFASFIEGTDAYKAREELYNALMAAKMSGGGDDSITSINDYGVFEFFLPIIDALNWCMQPYNWNLQILRETVFAKGESEDFVHPLNIFKYIGIALNYVMKVAVGLNKVLFIPLIFLYISVFFLAFVTELALMLIDTIVFDPIRFVCEEIKQHYVYRDKEYLYLPTEEYRGAAKIYDAFEAERVETLYESTKALGRKTHRRFLEAKEDFKPWTQKKMCLH